MADTPNLDKLFSSRQIFAFVVPGFFILLAIYYLLHSFIKRECLDFQILMEYKEYILLWGTLVVILLSFYIGLVVLKISSKVIFFISEDNKFEICENQDYIRQKYDKIREGHNGRIQYIDKKYNQETSSAKNHIQCKYTVIANSPDLGKILSEVEIEFNLYGGTIVPMMIFAFVSLYFLFFGLFQDISLNLNLIIFIISFILTFGILVYTDKEIKKLNRLRTIFMPITFFIALYLNEFQYFLYFIIFWFSYILYTISVRSFFEVAINEINTSIQFYEIMLQKQNK